MTENTHSPLWKARLRGARPVPSRALRFCGAKPAPGCKARQACEALSTLCGDPAASRLVPGQSLGTRGPSAPRAAQSAPSVAGWLRSGWPPGAAAPPARAGPAPPPACARPGASTSREHESQQPPLAGLRLRFLNAFSANSRLLSAAMTWAPSSFGSSSSSSLLPQLAAPRRACQKPAGTLPAPSRPQAWVSCPGQLWKLPVHAGQPPSHHHPIPGCPASSWALPACQTGSLWKPSEI